MAGGVGQEAGVIPRAMQEVFSCSEERRKLGWEFEMQVSRVQLYCEKFSDMLDTQNNDIIKVDVTSSKLTNMKVEVVKNEEAFLKLFHVAAAYREVKNTALNDVSSRSHLLAQISVLGHTEAKGKNTEGLLLSVDLAGMEKFDSDMVEVMRVFLWCVSDL